MTQFISAVTDVNRNGRLGEGDSVRFGFHVVNEGTLSLSGMRIVDRRLERFHVAVSCGSASLAPGASTDCSSGALKITRFQAKKHKLGRNFAYAVATAGGTPVRSNPTVVTLTSDVRALPDTGSDLSAWQLWGSAFLLVSGAGLIGAGRRRRRRTPSAQG
jgi:LPXTG-motif cell wall-anchored protein